VHFAQQNAPVVLHFATQNADTNGLQQLCKKPQQKDLNVRKNKSCSHFYKVNLQSKNVHMKRTFT
jgi:hypothetical protein